MGTAGNLGLLWFVLGALGPAPPAAGRSPPGQERCHPTLGPSLCCCPPGFEGPPWDCNSPWDSQCEDINECLGEGSPCPPLQSCNNTEGGFQCLCNAGYRARTPKNGTGTPENGTGTPKNGTGTPKNGIGTPKNGIGTPKNGTGTPENGIGTPKNGTGTPKNGTGTPENGIGTPENGIDCEDVDECLEGGEGRCRGGSVCLNTPGGFECHCPPPGRGPPGPGGCPAVPVPPEICAEEEGCDLGETLARISQELRGGRDPRSILQELLSVLGGALGVPSPPPARLSALLRVGEGLARAAGAGLPPGSVTNVTAPGAALSMAVSRGPPPGPVTLGVPEVTLEVPPEVALDKDSGLALVALLSLGGLPAALEGAPPVLWGGWGSLPRPPRRGRAFRSYRVLSPVATAFVTREVAPRPRGGPAVTLGFRHPPPDPELGGRVLCAFWNPREGRWDSRGCREVPPKNGTPPPGSPPGTVCACDHLTSFAVLLAFNEIQDHWLLDLVTQVSLAVSVVALVASALTFALCRALGGLRRALHLHLSLSLLGGHLAFLLGIDRGHSPALCTVTAVSLHLCFLSAFSWMALQGLHLHVLLVRVFPPAWLRPRHLLALGYGPPAAIVALSAALYPGGYGTDQYCWLSLKRGFRWSFQGPVIVITAANAAILVVTLWKLVQKFHEANPDMGHLRKIRVLLVTSLGQLSLLGSGWVLGLGAGLGWAGGGGGGPGARPSPPAAPPRPSPSSSASSTALRG